MRKTTHLFGKLLHHERCVSIYHDDRRLAVHAHFRGWHRAENQHLHRMWVAPYTPGPTPDDGIVSVEQYQEVPDANINWDRILRASSWLEAMNIVEEARS